MSTVDDHRMPSPSDDQPRDSVYSFEDLAGDPALRGRARYLAWPQPTLRQQTLADVDKAYQALGNDPGDRPRMTQGVDPSPRQPASPGRTGARCG